MSRGFFVTGTDTGVGKTVVTAALATVLRERGQDVGVMKPFASGCVRRREGLVSEDAEVLAKAAEALEPLEAICPVRFAEPLAPTVAAARAGTAVDLDAMWAAWRRLRAAHAWMLVEGIGGLLCPVTPDRLLGDLAGGFDLPLLIVARPGLGTLNHTLLTVEAARRRQLRFAGILVCGYNIDTGDAAELTNPDELQRVTGLPVLALMPYDTETDLARGIVGPDVLAAVRRLDLRRLVT